jgi:hypothetical protein
VAERPFPQNAAFTGGPLDGQTKRLSELPATLDVYRHRQATTVVEVGLGHMDIPRQPKLWERFDYDRVHIGDGWADYALTEPRAERGRS